MPGCSNNPNPTEWTDEDTYFFAKTVDPISFDPSISYDTSDAPIIDPIYPSYFRFGYLHQNPWTLELNIGMNEPIRTPTTGTIHSDKGDVSYHGERWDFELRHDIRFQDDPCFPGGAGLLQLVTAKDVEYEFKRLDDPAIAFPLESNLADKLIGWEEYRKGFEKHGHANYDRPLEGFVVNPLNPYKFSVSFNQPYPQFRFIMAMHFTTPVPREAVEKYPDTFSMQHPVGCGPFRLSEYSAHKRFVTVRNPNNTFWRYPSSAAPGTPAALMTDAGEVMPFVKRMVFTEVLEQVTGDNVFEPGSLDSWAVEQGNAQFMLSAIRPGATMTQRGVKMETGAYPSIFYCGFNMNDPTYGGYTPAKRKLRQAVSLSIDSEEYISLMYQGLAKKSEFMLPQGLTGYDPTFVNPYRVYDPRLVKAKQLLADAGYPNAIDPKTHSEKTTALTLSNSTQSPVDRQRAEFLAKQIGALGIRVTINAESAPTFSDDVIHGKTQFFQYGWIADYPDPENFLMLLNGANSPDPNYTHYDNKEFNQLFDQMRNLDDGPARVSLINRMRALAVEDCPWIFLCEQVAPTAFQPWSLHKQSNPILNDLPNYVKLDVPQRKKDQAEWNSPVLGPAVLLLGICAAAIIARDLDGQTSA